MKKLEGITAGQASFEDYENTGGMKRIFKGFENRAL